MLIGLAESVRVNGALAAIQVYDHGFAKDITYAPRNGNVIPENKTSSFTQNDVEAYAYLVAAFYAVNFTWQWYNPDGQLYINRTQQAQCTSTPCTVTSGLWLGRSSPANTMFGTWRLEVLANGNPLYSDYFTLSPIVSESDHWSFEIFQSAPPRVHANLTVTIHPANQSWTSYSLFIPSAANLTAYEPTTKSPLQIIIQKDSAQHPYYFVDFRGPRSDGYSFVLSFDLAYGLSDLSGWYGGQFALTWDEHPYQRFSANPVPETFSITLPKGAKFIDAVGLNVIPLAQTVTQQTSISFNSTFIINHPVEWTIIYLDFTYRNAHTNTLQLPGLTQLSQIVIPFLPLTLGNVNLWAAVMSVFLLTASELISPLYGRSGFRILINRKPIRIAALLLVALFIVTTGYQLFATFPH
jgi:hypothetical protein